jgi:hypothetical protein
MKTFFTIVISLFLLTGCANAKWRAALDSTNQVKNGMTLPEVITIMGIPPSYSDGRKMLWGYGTYTSWNGTRKGAARFLFKNDLTYGIPDGGMFSPAAVELFKKEQEDEAIKAISNAEAARISNEKAAIDRKAAQLKKEQNDLLEIQAEITAIAGSTLKCHDKSMCTKMFSLAQIYISKHADQKIQVATDTIIETYNPTDAFKIGMTIIKTPKQGSNEEVALTVNCKDPSAESTSYCRLKRIQIYAGFRPFMESNLAK